MKQNLWALYYKKSKTTTNLRTAQEQILNESRLRNQMNDRMDPLVANEGGIEAITLIIFYESETEKFTKIRDDEAQNKDSTINNCLETLRATKDIKLIILFFYFIKWTLFGRWTKLNIFEIIKFSDFLW